MTRAFEQIRHHCRTGTGARYLLTRAFEQIRRHFGTPTSAGYTLTRAFQVSGALDVGALERSLAEMVRRHEILRTTYVLVEGEPWQVIGPPDAPPVAVLDLRGRPHDVERITRGDTTRTLDLARGPLLRAVVLRLAETEYRLLLVMHHITYDAESTEIFFRELRLLYGGFASGTSPRLAGPGLQYADYAAWQRQRMRLDGDGHRRQLADWMDRLGGLGRSYLELPFRETALRGGDAGGGGAGDPVHRRSARSRGGTQSTRARDAVHDHAGRFRGVRSSTTPGVGIS